jgi:pimeloyl-ACP methyl ester carboxylesterase
VDAFSSRASTTINRGETFVVVSGPQDATPLLLLHGSGANATMWRDDFASWAQHFRTYAIDIIGEPGLSAPARPPLNSERLALWLDDVFDSQETAERVRQCIPPATVHLLPEVGHAILGQTDSVLAFLRV